MSDHLQKNEFYFCYLLILRLHNFVFLIHIIDTYTQTQIEVKKRIIPRKVTSEPCRSKSSNDVSTYIDISTNS